MIFTSWTLSTDSSLIFIRGVWNQLPKRMMLQLKSLFVICPLFRRLIFRMRRFELYEGNRCFEPFLFNPNLHALHNWKGTPLERIHCQALWRWNHDYTMNSMCKCSIFKLDTWCLMLHHNFMKRQCPELFSTKMSNSEFLKHKISERMIAQPLFSERHELGKVKITFNVQHFFCICSIQHVFWCDRKIRTMGLEDSLSVYWCPG